MIPKPAIAKWQEFAPWKEYGQMVAAKNNDITSVPIIEAIKDYHYVNTDSFTIEAARRMGVSFGD